MTKLIFEGNFIAKLLPSYRKCKKIAKIFACGELNLLDFEQVNIVAPKRFGKTEMDLIRIQKNPTQDCIFISHIAQSSVIFVYVMSQLLRIVKK